jgi:hypothetical protein
VSSQPPADLRTLWGIVNRAVRDPELRARPGGVVQNIWESYKQSYVGTGATPPRLGIQQVNPLVSMAAAQARAELELSRSIQTYNRTGLDQAIIGAHIAPDIDSRARSGGAVADFHRVRFSIGLNVEGERMERIVTWSPELNLPSTVSGLLEALTEAGSAAAEDYGEDFTDLGELVSITAY